MPSDYRIIGSSRSEGSDDDFRELARRAVAEFGLCRMEEDVWEGFARRLSFVAHEFTPADTKPIEHALRDAEAAVGSRSERLFYLAVPPDAFAPITEAIGECDLQDRARVVFEKPFGRDLGDFTRLNELVHSVLDESQVYRIDHFLGKETVQNILAFRFANGMFEPVWNRHHIDHVQIEVLEDIDVGSRAEFYDQTGALRDMLVTHLFQLLGFVAMEPPPLLQERPLAEEVLKLFDTVEPLQVEDVVRSQYEGYRSTDGVDPSSDTETFVAAKLRVDNWRWAGVPFFLRTGKALKQRRSSVTLAFRDPPRQMFREAPVEWLERDHLSLELGPEEGISMTFLAKIPGPMIELGPAQMVFRYDGSFGSEMISAYERLIHDALIGDRTLFTRGDGIERAWELVDKVIHDPPPVTHYAPGTWGPEAGDELIAPRRWHASSRGEEWG